MRPNTCWTLLHVSVLAMLFLILEAESADECQVQIKVHKHKHTKYTAVLGEELKIKCPVTYCNHSPPEISWVKFEDTYVPVNVSRGSRFKSEFTVLKDLEGVSLLIIQNFIRNDSGIYQCKSNSSVGHKINVSVSGNGANNSSQDDNDNNTSTDPELYETLRIYVYPAAGIVAFVLFVIIVSVASMRGCKGKPKKDTKEDNQYMAIPMVEQPFPSSNTQPSPTPRGISPVPLQAQRSIRRKTPPPHPREPPSPRDNECVYSKAKHDRDPPRSTVEEQGSSVVYAALNHQLPARPVARPRRLKEECSEYAAIRVKDPYSS